MIYISEHSKCFSRQKNYLVADRGVDLQTCPQFFSSSFLLTLPGLLSNVAIMNIFISISYQYLDFDKYI